MPGCQEQPGHKQPWRVTMFLQTGKLFHMSCRPVLCSTATLGEILQICYGTWWMNGGLLTKTLLWWQIMSLVGQLECSLQSWCTRNYLGTAWVLRAPTCAQDAHCFPSSGKNLLYCGFFFLLFWGGWGEITIASHALTDKQKLVNLPKHKLLTDPATRWMICWSVQMVRHYSLLRCERMPRSCGP